MLLFFVVFIFFILHIQFLLRNILFGLDELNYFQFLIKYDFERDIAIQSFLFSIMCMLSYAVCYKFFYINRRKLSEHTNSGVNSRVQRHELFLLNIMGIIMIAYMLVVIGLSNFDYTALTLFREANGFIFELRIIFLLMLSHLLLNIPWKELLKRRDLKTARLVILVYCICTLLFQTRSTVFEIAGIIAFSQNLWKGDKVKIKYILLVIGVMLVPNLIVIGRLGIPEYSNDLISGLFSFEYSIVINNFLSAAIYSSQNILSEISFIPSMELIIPSPIRNFFGIVTVKSSYYSDISDAAGMRGGGFSLLAEMYSNFGWGSFLVFGLLGTIIGHYNSRASRVGNVDLHFSSAPLLYVSFILSFRNDFGVFLKYSIQIIIISWILNLILINFRSNKK